MIGYVTVGTNDLERARDFFAALFGSIGAGELMRMDHGFTMYGTSFGQPGVCVTPPYAGGLATPGNGPMTALILDARAKVDALYTKAIELGGSDEGAPGVRGEEGPQAFYAGYFRDLDGNKFCGFCVGPA